MKNDKTVKQLYQKMLDGTASPEEQELLVRWLNQLEIGRPVSQQETDERQEQAVVNLLRMTGPAAVVKWTRKAAWPAAAAAILLVAATAWLLRPAAPTRIIEEVQQTVVYTVHTATAGQRKLLTLSDGSRVWLGNASTIRYPKDFQTDTREVVLEGHAFFEVTPDAERPFYVHTDELTIRVLGTSFDVKHYPGDAERTVTVASGKVSVAPAHSQQAWALEKGQQVMYYPATKSGDLKAADLSVALSWKDGELIFRDKPLEEIRIQLERWYGVDIRITSDLLKNRKLSLSVKNEPLETVLKMLAIAGEFHFEIDEKTVNIRR